MSRQYKIYVGIDPGTKTGVAIWLAAENRFNSLDTMNIVRAMDLVRAAWKQANDEKWTFALRYEDARLRKVFSKMDAKQEKWGAAIREGAGAAKRDSTIWEEFCAEYGIPAMPVSPTANKTKMSAAAFASMTGWTGRTSEHSRDAGMLVWGMR